MVWPRAMALAMFFSSALSLRADDSTKYDLKYNFKLGEVIRSEVVHKATVETTIQGNRQTAETRTTSIKAWKVDDVKSDGTTKFVHMVESTDMWHRMQGRQEVKYNSLTDETPPQGFEDAAKRVGVPLSVITMDCARQSHQPRREDRQEQYESHSHYRSDARRTRGGGTRMDDALLDYRRRYQRRHQESRSSTALCAEERLDRCRNHRGGNASTDTHTRSVARSTDNTTHDHRYAKVRRRFRPGDFAGDGSRSPGNRLQRPG